MTDHGHDHQGHDHAWAFEGPEEVERVTRDGEISQPFVAMVTSQLAGRDVGRVLDVGAGPGVGTCELARLLPQARIIALEPSESMGAALADRAAALGVDDRVEVRRGGLPDGLVGIEDIDLVWASMSLHHVADEVAALQAIRSVLSDDGVVALAERTGMPAQVIPDLRPGLASRLRAVYETYFDHMRHTLEDQVESGDLAAMVEAAGLTVRSDEERSITHAPPLSVDQRAYVAAWTERTLEQLAERLDPQDREAIEAYVADPRRTDAPVTITRRMVIASR